MCVKCDWEEFIEELDELLEDKDYEWAEDTISGIKSTVSAWKHKTEGQETAIENIKDAVRRRK